MPRRRALWIAGGITAVGVVGAIGALGPQGPWLGVVAILVGLWTLWRHRWPTELPLRLRPAEPAQGPDERAVAFELRQDGKLLGWDVGILWFERGGVGFAGRTVTFVLPRALMHVSPTPATLRSVLRGPQITAEVLGATVGIVPMGRELDAQMTLARIDALPEAKTADTVLPPSSLHPELLQRALEARRRAPVLTGMMVAVATLPYLPVLVNPLPSGVMRGVYSVASLLSLIVIAGVPSFASALPQVVRARIPEDPRRR